MSDEMIAAPEVLDRDLGRRPYDVNQPRFRQFARAEQAVHRERGKTLSIEEVLALNGFLDRRTSQTSGTSRSVSMSELSMFVPTSEQLAMDCILREIRDGVLFIKTSGDLKDNDVERVLRILRAARLTIDDVKIDLAEREEINEFERHQEEVPSERLPRLFQELQADPDNVVLMDKVIQDIYGEALQLRASDIHMHSVEDDAKCWIRYRIDGELHARHRISHRIMAPLVTRIKTDSKMDAAERTVPQDGRMTFTWQGRSIDLRTAVLPKFPNGEKITIRVLDAANLKTFEELFRDFPMVARRMRRVLHSPIKDGGLILVSGPTNSGKSTTLVGIILELDRLGKAVYSVETPAEYELPMVDQISIGENSPIDSSAFVKALLRHDPNVVVIGEMRDPRTAEAALRLVETGTLVIATVHSADAINTLDRVKNMLDPEYRDSGLNILGHQLSGVLNQRLIRKVCPKCHQKMKAREAYGSAIICSKLGINSDHEISIASERGCDICSYTGYLGRALILECLFPSDNSLSRRIIADHLRDNMATRVPEVEGVIHLTRNEDVLRLIKDGTIDALMGADLLLEGIGSGGVGRGHLPGDDIFDDLL